MKLREGREFKSERAALFCFICSVLIGMEVKPCKGEKPVTDPVTGRELDCGNGPFRQDCPSGTYCHQTTRFSRCCRKGKLRNFILIISLVK